MPDPITREFLELQEHLSGRYSIERELGRGGMGIVLLARDVALDRLVAIKLLPPALAADRSYRERFLREARTAAGLSHPNIVPIHTVEEHGDLVFFVMGFVDGETLRERVERAGMLSPRHAMKLMQDVAWALTYAHQRGVIHRDVKPDNIMIEHGTDRALVTDFGIALGRRDAEGGEGEVIGTARYMSPEQACGEPVDARSDLYSLGATFFYALTGRAPIEGKSLPAILARQTTEPAPPIRTLRTELPVKLAKVIDRSLQKAPDDRWPSGDEVARLLDVARGRHLRAPPLIRSFVRNAQVTTMVVLAVILANGVTIGSNVAVDLGPGLIGTILIFQLLATARRLLREGYSFRDIRQALLAEAQLQDEEAEELRHQRWLRWLNARWHRLWAGRFGKWFFRISGFGLQRPSRPVLPSSDATEVVLGRSTIAAFEALSHDVRRQAPDAPAVIERLEQRAVRLRAANDSGPELVATVDALEHLRLAMFRLEAGLGSVQDLTEHLNRARAIGEAVDRRIAAGREVDAALGKG